MAVKRMNEVRIGASEWMHKPRKIQRLVWMELLRATVGEFFATFMFVGAVLAAIINNGRLPGLGAAGAMAVGVAVAYAGVATCWAFGDVSGAMFNPAITFGFVVAGKMSLLRGAAYMLAQFSGAIAAGGIMYLVFPANLEGVPSVSALIPLGVPQGVEPVTAILMEAFLTFCLVYVVFATAVDRMPPLLPVPALLPTDADIDEKVSDRAHGEQGLSAQGGLRRYIPKIGGRFRAGRLNAAPVNDTKNSNPNLGNSNNMGGGASSRRPLRYIQVYTNNGPTKRDWAPLSIGFTLGFLAFLGASVTGGGFNPARAFAAALLANNWNSIYVYFAGPFVGGAVAALFHTFFLAFEGAALSAIPEDTAVKRILQEEKREERRDRQQRTQKTGATPTLPENRENRQ
jgi:glycerol uptake facilitator-like aquaporin